MKKLILLLTVVTMLVAAPAVLAGSSGTACAGSAAIKHLGLRVSGLSCHQAYKALTKGSAGFKCHTIGQTKHIPVLVKCINTKHQKVFYIYKVYGG